MKKSRALIGLVLATGLCGTLFALCPAGGEGEEEAKEEKISLQVAVVVDGEPGLLAFSLKNEGRANFRRHGWALIAIAA